MLMNDLPWFSERREHQGPAETSQELLLRAERGLGETASNPAHLGVGGRMGERRACPHGRRQLCLTSGEARKATLLGQGQKQEGCGGWRVEGGGGRVSGKR